MYYLYGVTATSLVSKLSLSCRYDTIPRHLSPFASPCIRFEAPIQNCLIPCSKLQALLGLNKTQHLYPVCPVLFSAPYNRLLIVLQAQQFLANIVRNARTMSAEMNRSHVDCSLIDSIKLCRIVHSASLSLLVRKMRAVAAPNSNLPENYRCIPSPRSSLDVVLVCCENFDLFSSETLKLGKTQLVTITVDREWPCFTSTDAIGSVRMPALSSCSTLRIVCMRLPRQ